ncbi:hypothetical protein ENUP19_0172G0019 [Entamoeba nuttalli]|uniref:GTP-binding protein EhRabX27, putative n=2 Tax=Entamoeba nuttalli TaxID=412467 RepID=K2H112_ENTNP|nr:GTP-binding protein EhRabX27, putative [Entamoeba nuttalli P19]EKE41173.1 GTP-binding protein EhRabX27, putative [Entamoeba nuttalli P19]|eukprot:XP_008856481.1 GTP-binding protein EhRabX27, putative [Entamoeba nuttalli P19]
MQPNNTFIKIETVGSQGSGKSSIIYRIMNKEPHQGITTIGCEVNSLIVSFERRLWTCKLWDIEERLREASLAKGVSTPPDALLIVIDLTQSTSLEWARNYINNKLGIETFGMLVVGIGNKCNDKKKNVSSKEVRQLFQQYHFEYYETDVVDNVGISQMFCDTIHAIVERKIEQEHEIHQDNEMLNEFSQSLTSEDIEDCKVV